MKKKQMLLIIQINIYIIILNNNINIYVDIYNEYMHIFEQRKLP